MDEPPAVNDGIGFPLDGIAGSDSSPNKKQKLREDPNNGVVREHQQPFNASPRNLLGGISASSLDAPSSNISAGAAPHQPVITDKALNPPHNSTSSLLGMGVPTDRYSSVDGSSLNAQVATNFQSAVNALYQPDQVGEMVRGKNNHLSFTGGAGFVSSSPAVPPPDSKNQQPDQLTLEGVANMGGPLSLTPQNPSKLVVSTNPPSLMTQQAAVLHQAQQFMQAAAGGPQQHPVQLTNPSFGIQPGLLPTANNNMIVGAGGFQMHSNPYTAVSPFVSTIAQEQALLTLQKTSTNQAGATGSRLDLSMEKEKNISGRKPLPLYMPCDEDSLSEYQCLVRRQIEIFEAGATEIESNAKGRNKPIVLGQLGIRCRHCSVLSPKQRARGATYYPAKLNGLYQAAQSMASGHLCFHCTHIPPGIRQELLILRERKSSAGGGKKYWGDGVRVLGVYEDSDGLRFKKTSI